MDTPIVWVLHIAYGWLVIGLLLKAIVIVTGAAAAGGWLHALTVGAISSMILGVMTRAALGHTGRPLIVSRPIVVVYGLLTLAALLRAVGPALPARWYVDSVLTAGGCWLLGFILYLFVYTPILIGPRVDGKSG